VKKLESEDIAAVREDFKRSMGKLTDEGSNMKLEIQSLKKVEKVMKVRGVVLSSGRRRASSEQEGFRVLLLCIMAKPVSLPLQLLSLSSQLRRKRKSFGSLTKDFDLCFFCTQVEIENLRKLVEKMQQETAEVERERGTSSQMESCVRERLLIMERVESLSQLYLGGLEEVRNDVFNIKFTCRDRLDELESQWSEYKRQQETSSEDGPSSSVSRQVSSLTRSSLDLHLNLHGFCSTAHAIKVSAPSETQPRVCFHWAARCDHST
jgi:hypothetical protein